MGRTGLEWIHKVRSTQGKGQWFPSNGSHRVAVAGQLYDNFMVQAW